MKPKGKRLRGRPRTRRLDQIQEDIEDSRQTWTEIYTAKTWVHGDG